MRRTAVSLVLAAACTCRLATERRRQKRPSRWPPPLWRRHPHFHSGSARVLVSLLVGLPSRVLLLRAPDRRSGAPRLHPAAVGTDRAGKPGGALVLLREHARLLPVGPQL